MPAGPTKIEKKTDKRYYLSRDCTRAIFAGDYGEAQKSLHTARLKESKFYALTASNELDVYSTFILACAEKDKRNSFLQDTIKADIHFDNFLEADNDENLLIKYSLFESKKTSEESKDKQEELPKELKKIVKKYNELSSGEKKILKYKAKFFDNGNNPVDFSKVFEEMKNSFTSSDTKANKILAEMYLKGIGTKPDLKNAVEKQKIVVNSIKTDKKADSSKKKKCGKKGDALCQRKLEKALETINLAKLQVYGNKNDDAEKSFNAAESLLCELVNHSAVEEYIFPLAALYVHLYCRAIHNDEFDKAADYFEKFFALCRQLGKKQMENYLDCFCKVTDLSKTRAKVLYILTQIQSGKIKKASSENTPDKLKGRALYEIDRNGDDKAENFSFEINIEDDYEDNKVLSNAKLNDDFFIGSLYCQASAFRSAVKYYEELKQYQSNQSDKIDMLIANSLYAAGDSDGAKKLYKELCKNKANSAEISDSDSLAFILDDRYTFANVLYNSKGGKARKLYKELSKEYKDCNAIKEKLKYINRKRTIATLSVIAIILCVVAAVLPTVIDKV